MSTTFGTVNKTITVNFGTEFSKDVELPSNDVGEILLDDQCQIECLLALDYAEQVIAGNIKPTIEGFDKFRRVCRIPLKDLVNFSLQQSKEFLIG